jgi:hypothetical protein
MTPVEPRSQELIQMLEMKEATRSTSITRVTRTMPTHSDRPAHLFEYQATAPVEPPRHGKHPSNNDG